MEKKNQVPKYPHLRFPEFTDEWKEVTLGEVAEISKGSGISKDQLSPHGLPCILYGELYTKYSSELISEIISHTELDPLTLIFSKAEDVIIPSSGETAIDIAVARCVPIAGVAIGGDLNIIRSEDTDGAFLAYQLNGIRKKGIAKMAQGSSIVHLYGHSLSKLAIAYPSLPEQRKIAALLSLIDERIEVQNAIIKEQEVAKTSLIRRLFDRTLRFPEFTDEWKEVKLGEICPSIQSGKDKKEEGEIPLYGAAKQLAYTRSASYSPPLILIGRVGSVGQLQWIDIPCGVSDNALVIQKGEGEAETVDIRFLFYCLKMAHLEQYAGGSSQKVITASFLKSLPLHLPLLPEQRKIADLLSAVDERITVEKEYATLLQKQKAYLLRQMFV